MGEGEIVFYNDCLIVADPLCYVGFTCVHMLLRTRLGNSKWARAILIFSYMGQDRLALHIMYMFPGISNFQNQHVCFVEIDCSAAVLGAVGSKFSHPSKKCFLYSLLAGRLPVYLRKLLSKFFAVLLVGFNR